MCGGDRCQDVRGRASSRRADRLAEEAMTLDELADKYEAEHEVSCLGERIWAQRDAVLRAQAVDLEVAK